jgi:hypothetical protein
MKKLEYAIRGLMYFISLVIYTLLAAWVGEGRWDETHARFLAAMLGVFWLVCTSFIEAVELPQEIAKALTEE